MSACSSVSVLTILNNKSRACVTKMDAIQDLCIDTRKSLQKDLSEETLAASSS